jgi:hypothetical protein
VLALVDSAITYPVNPAGSPQLATFTVDGVRGRWLERSVPRD